MQCISVTSNMRHEYIIMSDENLIVGVNFFVRAMNLQPRVLSWVIKF